MPQTPNDNKPEEVKLNLVINKEVPKFQVTEREYNEIMFAQLYATGFNHGTAGHLAYKVIARLAEIATDLAKVKHIQELLEVVDPS